MISGCHNMVLRALRSCPFKGILFYQCVYFSDDDDPTIITYIFYSSEMTKDFKEIARMVALVITDNRCFSPDVNRRFLSIFASSCKHTACLNQS